MAEGDLAPLDTNKQVVVYGNGWGFVLPQGHTIRLNINGGQVSLGTGGSGGTYDVERVDDSDANEYRVFMAPGGASATRSLPGQFAEGYPFPTIDVELDRLRGRWEDAGG